MKILKRIFEKYDNKEISDKKKIENMIYIVIMLVVVVVGINSVWFSDNKKENTQSETNSSINNEIYLSEKEENLETKLKNILEKVNGVSNVNVLINYTGTKQINPVYDVEEKETTTNENDTQGGTRNIISKEYNKKIVYEEENNNKNIIVEKEDKAKISGVIVVANFSNNLELKEQIIKAVADIANISEYKVQVLSGN